MLGEDYNTARTMPNPYTMALQTSDLFPNRNLLLPTDNTVVKGKATRFLVPATALTLADSVTWGRFLKLASPNFPNGRGMELKCNSVVLQGIVLLGKW